MGAACASLISALNSNSDDGSPRLNRRLVFNFADKQKLLVIYEYRITSA
jgi:hypothetical protein